MTQPTPVAVELAAMKRIVAALAPLDDESRYRVVTWLYKRYDRSRTEVGEPS